MRSSQSALQEEDRQSKMQVASGTFQKLCDDHQAVFVMTIKLYLWSPSSCLHHWGGFMTGDCSFKMLNVFALLWNHWNISNNSWCKWLLMDSPCYYCGSLKHMLTVWQSESDWQFQLLGCIMDYFLNSSFFKRFIFILYIFKSFIFRSFIFK